MHHLLAQHSYCLGEAWFQGILYRVSWYPCAIPSDYPHDKVIGELYQLHDADFILNQLDDYEECSAHFPVPHEYTRMKQTVFSSTLGAVEAWAYMYNHPINGLERIISGDFFYAPQHFLNFLPLPQWQGSLRPGRLARCRVGTRDPIWLQIARKSYTAQIASL